MSTTITIRFRFDVTGVLHGLWWCTTISITHFYMVSASTMSYNISETMIKLSLSVQKMLPKTNHENIFLEENYNELLCGSLKRIEDAYDGLCNCCSALNDVFGFSEIFAGAMNLLQLGITFYAMTMMAVSFEAVQRAARGLRRSLALLSSELLTGDISLDVQMLARDVLHAVRARQPRLSACGLFELRMTLLTGLLSLTATYSIVLLQFTHFL
ncbi:hypothetical protein EVAR_57226_1 [Eumeta japonica]|uniref:Gustatory receptor n=1 Tax=Eumeta variegata TaxID=151549 RepID=A0A4C1YHD6_EUMVA|nr:hypothetical protein EVAR_57226_1 [Eumeta japonica]